MALVASAWVTTEQESNLLVTAPTVVVVDTTGAPVDATGAVVEANGALVVGPALDALDDDELHAARAVTTGTATMILTTPGRNLIGPLDRRTFGTP